MTRFVKVTLEVIIDIEQYTEGQVANEQDKLVAAAELVESEYANAIYSEVDDCRVTDARFVSRRWYEAWFHEIKVIGGKYFVHPAAPAANLPR